MIAVYSVYEDIVKYFFLFLLFVIVKLGIAYSKSRKGTSKKEEEAKEYMQGTQE